MTVNHVPDKMETILMPILQMSKLRLERFCDLVQLTVRWWNWDLNPGLSGSPSYILNHSALPPLEPLVEAIWLNTHTKPPVPRCKMYMSHCDRSEVRPG